MPKTILDRWDMTPEELTELVENNPSLRGMILGYLAELKLEKFWLSGTTFQKLPSTMITIERRRATESSGTRDKRSSLNRNRYKAQ